MKITFELLALIPCDHRKNEVFSGVAQSNKNLHLVHTVSGGGRLKIADHIFQASPGQVFSVPPFTPTLWEKDAGSNWKMLNIHFRVLRADGLPFDTALPVTFRPKRFPHLLRSLQTNFRAARKENTTDQLQGASGLLELIARYWRDFAQPLTAAAPIPPTLLRLHRQITNSASQEFEAEKFAATLHVSVSQMNRLFRRAFGLAPKELWLRQRLILAREMLMESDEKLDVVAQKLGFSDQYYFSKWIRSRLGMPPGEFRRREARSRNPAGSPLF